MRYLHQTMAVALCLGAALASSVAEAVEPPPPLLARQEPESKRVAPVPSLDVPADPKADFASDGVSLDALENLALQYHPTIAESAWFVEAGRWNRLQVGLPPNPTLGYAGGEIGNEGQAGQQGAFLEQTLVRGGKLSLNRAVAQQEVEKLQADLAARRLRVLTDLRIGFYQLLALQERAHMLARMEEITEQAAETADQLFQARESPRTDYLLARIQLERVRLDRQSTERERQGAARQLAARVGLERLPADTLIGDLELLGSDLDWDQTWGSLLVTHPLLAAAQADVRRARCAVDRARAEVVPDLTTQVTLQHDNATGDTIVGIQTGVNLPVWNRNQGGIGQACAELRAAEQHVQHVQLRLRERLATVFANYEAARIQVERYQTEILPQAGETQRLVAQGYRQGELSFLEYLTAQLTFFQSSVNYLDALRNYWTDYHRVNGLLLDANLETSP
jgi:cobalt-zinc-cadmium efflux system outer membrane protein